jgi:hypothetical protein
MKEKKAFDCVEFQHEWGDEITRRTAHMTIDEQVAYWAERTEALRREQAELRARIKQAAGT